MSDKPPFQKGQLVVVINNGVLNGFGPYEDRLLLGSVHRVMNCDWDENAWRLRIKSTETGLHDDGFFAERFALFEGVLPTDALVP